MKAGWRTERLGTLCEFDPSKSQVRDRLVDNIAVSFVPMNDLGVEQQNVSGSEVRPLSEVYKGYTYFADGDVLLAKITPCFENGKLGVASGLENKIGFGSSEFMVLRPGSKLLARYLAYFLSQNGFREAGQAVMSGAVGHKRVPKEWVENCHIPTPPFAEQQRIVALLDEAFKAIITATAHGEKNVANARSLFERSLERCFTPDSETIPLSSLASDITDGDHMPPPKAEQGVPFITISNIDKARRTIDFERAFRVSPVYFKNLKQNRKPKVGDVLYSVTGSFGIPVLIEQSSDFCFQRHIGLVRPNANVVPKWIYYFLMSPNALAQADAGATGTAQRTVSLNVLRNFAVPIMSEEAQRQIVRELDAISKNADQLNEISLRRLNLLVELKQSLLARAFSGELTASDRVTVEPANDNIFSTSEQVANVLAFVHWLHEVAKRDKTFGHTKAQKALHLLESIGGVELGRTPVKAKAGPNDFPHMLNAEDWAKERDFFEFVKRPTTGGGYDFVKLANYGKMLAAAKLALKPIEGEIERTAQLILPLDSESAQVLATVHAAWNNLLLDGCDPTDDAIVFEARDNWHPSKFGIPEAKFRDAIRLIRERGIVPDGSAKRVAHSQMPLPL